MSYRTPPTIRHAAMPLAAAGAALLLAACGSSNNNPPANAGKTPSPASFAADAYRHAECMRRHGVPDFPNPQVVNTPTEHGIRQALPQGVAESPQFKTAQAACKGIIPEPRNGGPGGNAAEQHDRAQTLLAFARCLRSHGVQGFPDPNAQGQLTLTTIHAAGVDLQAPSFLTAAKACVGVTHGAITLAQVEQAVHHTGGEQPGGSEAAAASPTGK
jgi:hypothetical protein